MATYRVLALDGGGIRGLLTTILLQRLCSEPGLEGAFEDVDLIAGNSSGALIALAMAHGLGQPTMALTLARIREVFERGAEVFGPEVPWYRVPYWLSAKYGSSARERGLKAMLGEHTRLGDLQRHVLVPTFDLDNEGKKKGESKPVPRMWKPKIFHNFAGDDNSDRDTLAWKVGLYSTAAPAYFPTADGFIDGGVFANNPAMCALAQVFDVRYAPSPKPGLDEVLLLSVGAGQNLKFVEGDQHRWGALGWASKLVYVETDGTVGIADYQCSRLLRDKYMRLEPDIPAGTQIELDDVQRVQYLIDLAEGRVNGGTGSRGEDASNEGDLARKLEEARQWLQRCWMPGLPKKRARNSTMGEQTSKHVNTATELTCLLPIKQGFIPVLETTTYASRLRLVLEILHRLRLVSREARTSRPVLDIVDAARTVHAFSWTIVGQQNLLLSVAFDRPWEPYMRVVWKDLGPLIDLFLCNCDGYPSSERGFDEFARFVRQHQSGSSFFYPSSALTVDDQRYLVEFERLQRQDPKGFDLRAATLRANSPEEAAAEQRAADRDQAREQWVAALKVLYGLRSFYPEASDDHRFLHQAATALLEPSRANLSIPSSDGLDWYDSKRFAANTPGNGRHDVRKIEHCNVQGGILRPYRRVSHGCLILATVTDPVAARKFIEREAGSVSLDSDDGPHDRVYKNIAFTCNGLRQLGVKESVLAQLPKEFREGMETRAGLLGDVGVNHPDRWSLPEWNVRFGKPDVNGRPAVQFVGSLNGGPSDVARVRLSTVDIVVILQAVGHWQNGDEWAASPLRNRTAELCADAWMSGVQVLSVQPLRRLSKRRDDKHRKAVLSYEHFGFLDGISQPEAADVPDPHLRDQVETGELLVGFQNDRRDPAFPEKPGEPGQLGRSSIVDAGSFLVIRKLQQHVDAFERAIHTAKDLADPNVPIHAQELCAKMVGRWQDGSPARPGEAAPRNSATTNDFDFSGDQDGSGCPFHAHIRRSNPRPGSVADGRRPFVPRIARRGLAYGPTERSRDGERGMMFMAYNASIAEQFEVIQRWMTGGNAPQNFGSVGVFSRQPDPLLGLPDSEGQRIYRFVDAQDRPRHVDLGPEPFVTLKWGAYLFAPSIAALRELAKEPGSDLERVHDVVAEGERVIRALQTQDTQDNWAAVLEDTVSVQSGTTAAVGAAIRAAHRGVLRTKYGVLVASEELIQYVLKRDDLFSVREYQRRFERSVGKNYLGMDSGAEYRRFSRVPNDALRLIEEDRACRDAYGETVTVLKNAIETARVEVESAGADLGKDDVAVPLAPVIGHVLARLARQWFDIPDDAFIVDGDEPVAPDDKARCPFHFLAPSRYVFSSPNPRPIVEKLGQTHGQLLLAKARAFVTEMRRQENRYGSPVLRGPVSRKLFSEFKDDDDLLARMLLGLVFGFVPTVYGNAYSVLALWLRDETLWRAQLELRVAEGDVFKRAEAIRSRLERAMLTLAVPSMLHRTVIAPAALAGYDLQPSEHLVLLISAAAREILTRGGDLDLAIVFGGDRQRDPNHPTHACPGKKIATGVLMGLLAAILDVGELKPGPGLVTVLVPPTGLKITAPALSPANSPV
jgi:Dyp-type peroxidase family